MRGRFPLSVMVLHNRDFADDSAPGGRARADVARVAEDVAQALAQDPELSVEVRALDGDADLVAAELRRDPPALVFNLTESLEGDSRHEILVPALLDFAGIPYTGSDPLALGLALYKDRTKDMLRGRGIPTPAAVVIGRLEEVDGLDLGFPVIVKPVREDASIGITGTSVVRDRGALRARVADVLATLRQPVLCERYVEGREINVSFLGNAPREVLPLYEIDFGALPPHLPRIVSYESKWHQGSVEDRGTRPVRCEDLSAAVAEDVRATAIAAADALGVRDYGRVDLRLEDGQRPWVVDVNPNCDLARTAGFARAAMAAGVSYEELVQRICRLALERGRRVQGAARRATAVRRRTAQAR